MFSCPNLTTYWLLVLLEIQYTHCFVGDNTIIDLNGRRYEVSQRISVTQTYYRLVFQLLQ